MSFEEYLQDITAETDDDDETLLVSDLVLSDGAHSTMNAARKPVSKRSVVLLVVIAVSSVVFIGSVIVIGVFAAKQRAHNQLRQKVEAEQNSFPIVLTRSPTISPSFTPSSMPSDVPSMMPSMSLQPSSSPTNLPSTTPSVAPSTAATQNTTIFYAVGDAPYTNDQAVVLLKDVLALPDGDFFVHLGDLRKAGEKCLASEYRRVSAILQESAVPVYVVLGDNDWNDCPNVNNGLRLWKDEFLEFDSQHWDVPWEVKRQKGREENFAFELKGTLFVGLNLVGGEIHSAKEWKSRLSEQAKWTTDVIEDYVKSIKPKIGRLVLFGHADPTEKHADFFDPLLKFIEKDLDNAVPFLYMNGDNHQWSYDANFMGQRSLLRIMVTGRSVDPPVQVSINANGESMESADAFLYDRRLEAKR